MEGYLKLFGNCFITNGASRSLIYDGQLKTYHLVPHSLVRFLERAAGQPIREVIASYDASDQSFVGEYLDFLLENRLAFFCDTVAALDRFPPVDTRWDYPALITNAVIEAATPEHIRLFNAAREDLFIPYVQLNVPGPVNCLRELEDVVILAAEKPVKGIQLLFSNDAGFSEAQLTDCCNRLKIVETMVAFNSGFEKLIRSETTHIHFTRQACHDRHSCGVVSPDYFNMEWQHYTESLQYNTCLNRKIAVCSEGFIRNCPSMPRSYGHISDTRLTAVISRQDFKELWQVKKDQISVCKDCEFRHICTDCRAYLEQPDNPYSKPLKCGYNPYTATWENWSVNPLKQQAASYYNPV